MTFNPLVRKKSFNDGMLDFYLCAEIDLDSPMGNIASSHLQSVISAWLVGLHDEIAPVIPRSLEWLDRAIASDEDFGTNRNFHRMTLHWAKALGVWMSEARNAPDVWDKARRFDLASLLQDDVCEKKQIPTYWLDDHMAFCFQAEQYEAGIAEFEKYHGAKALSLKKALKPREFAYAACLHKARQQFDASELLAAGRKMLHANLDGTWLGRGHFIRGATWLKIVYWHHDPSLTPLQTILKAYEDMPEVPCPEFVRDSMSMGV